MTDYFPLSVAAGKLRRTLIEGSELKKYQRGFQKWADGSLKTYCNIYATAMGEKLKYDMDSFYRDHDKKNASISPMGLIYNQLLRDALHTLRPHEAQAMANIGRFVVVWSDKYEHAAVVCPNTERYNAEKGPLIVQAGWWNGLFYISDPKSFGKVWKDPEIKYFAPEERQE